MTQVTQHLHLDTSNINDELIEISIDKIESPVLLRLIDEVKNDSESTVYSYDRVHNRHNR